MAQLTIGAIADWLIDGARDAVAPEKFFARLCEKLTETGIPLWRVGVFVRTLHPNIMGRSFVWRPGEEVVVGTATYDIIDTDTYRTSPLSTIYNTGQSVRHRIADGEGLEQSNFLKELRDEGVTDYVGFPMVFTDGSMHSVTLLDKGAGGLHRCASRIDGHSDARSNTRFRDPSTSAASPPRCLILTSAAGPANAFSPARSDAVPAMPLTRSSGCPICAESHGAVGPRVLAIGSQAAKSLLRLPGSADHKIRR